MRSTLGLAELVERAHAASVTAAERDRALAALETADLSRGDRTRAHARTRRERDLAELAEIEARAAWHVLVEPSLASQAARFAQDASTCARCIDAVHDALVDIADALDRDDTPRRIALGERLERCEDALDAAHDACRQALGSLAARSGRQFGQD